MRVDVDASKAKAKTLEFGCGRTEEIRRYLRLRTHPCREETGARKLKQSKHPFRLDPETGESDRNVDLVFCTGASYCGPDFNMTTQASE